MTAAVQNNTTVTAADRLAAADRLRELLLQRLTRSNLTPQQQTRAFRTLVATIRIIRRLNPPIPAEQEARALIAAYRGPLS